MEAKINQKPRKQLKPITLEGIQMLHTLDKETRTNRLRGHFGYFLIYYLQHYTGSKFAPFHYEMMGDVHDLLEHRIRELAWFMFGESAKTSFAKALILYLIAYDIEPYINADSFDSTNSERILFDVVWELQTNKRFLEDFGEKYNTTRSKDEATQKRIKDFITNPSKNEVGNIVREGIRVEAHSTQESVRGRVHGSMRPGFVLLDDFETKKTLKSEVSTSQIRMHIQEFKRSLDSGRRRVLYLGNILSEYGNVQSVIERAKHDPELRVRIVPICDGTLMTGLHSPTWPERWVMTDDEAKQTGKLSVDAKRRAMWTPEEGDSDFQAEMLCQPIDETKALFKREWFQPIGWEALMQKKLAAYVTIDTPSRKEGEIDRDGDFVGICINWVDREGKWHFKAWREKLGPTAIIEKMFGIYNFLIQAGTPAVKFGWEDTAFTRGLEPMLRHEQRMRQIFLPLMWLKHAGRSKEDRIRTGLLYRYETRSIFHLEGECKDLENELMRFPDAPHDDTSDAAAYQSDIARPAGTERPRDVQTGPLIDTPYGKVKPAYDDEWPDEGPQFPDIGI
jgi:hypothetical protein